MGLSWGYMSTWGGQVSLGYNHFRGDDDMGHHFSVRLEGGLSH